MKKQGQSKKDRKDPYVFLMEQVVTEVKKAVKARYGEDISIPKELLEIPPVQEMGDCALPCFFLSKRLKKSPIEIAQTLESACGSMIKNECIQQVRALGPYLNIFFYSAYIAD